MHINTWVQITNTRPCLVGGAHRSLNQRNVLSEPLTAPTLVRGNRRADTRAHTPGPYFNHKLMFCLPRMHNCASRAGRPGVSCRRRSDTRPTTGRDTTTRPRPRRAVDIPDNVTRNEASNGFANTPCNPRVHAHPHTATVPLSMHCDSFRRSFSQLHGRELFGARVR